MYGEIDCFACTTADKYFSDRKDIDYHFYDIRDESNKQQLDQLVPDFTNPKEPIDTSIPVIQKCTVDKDGKVTDCRIDRGFNEERYE